MKLQAVKIGKHTIKLPIIQGGMGVGVSWDKLAGSVSKSGALGTISCVGTGYYENKKHVETLIDNRPYEVQNFYSRKALMEIFKNARKICKDSPLAANVLYAINDYGRVVRDACEAGANIIITGAGLPTNMPEFTEGFPDIALIPIISSAKALRIICKRWKQRYNRLPDAIVVEGPLSGGHQGFTLEQCNSKEYQLENLIQPILEEKKEWGDFPLFAAGGVWDHADIARMINIGASGVQMGTRFLGTHECDAHDNFKQVIIDSKKEDVTLLKTPVGYPARAIVTNLTKLVEKREGPKIKCISNCVWPCRRGIGAKIVGFCIADRLGDAYDGDKELGLFFTGSNGYRVNKLVHVKDLIEELSHPNS